MLEDMTVEIGPGHTAKISVDGREPITFNGKFAADIRNYISDWVKYVDDERQRRKDMMEPHGG